MRKARLLVAIPAERVDESDGDESSPQAGDIVTLDHGLTFPDGKPGGLVYCMGEDGSPKYSADVYETEIQLIEDEEVNI